MILTTAPLLQDSVLERQIELETAAIRAGVARYRRLARLATERGDGANLKAGERWLVHWFEALTASLKQVQREVRRNTKGQGGHIHGPTLLLIEPERMAVIAMHETLGACMARERGALLPDVTYAIGAAVVAEASLDILAEDHADKLKELSWKCRNLNTQRINWWAKKTLEDPIWSRKVCTSLGATLFWSLAGIAGTAGYDQPFAPAFRVERRRTDSRRARAFVMLDDCVFAEIERSHIARQALRPRYLPMLVAPYPWLPPTLEGGRTDGGYVKIRTPFISKPSQAQKTALGKAKLDTIYQCLSAVTGPASRINKRILQWQVAAWETGGSIAGIPRASDWERPPKPADFDTNEEAKNEWKKAAAKVYGENARMRVERITFLQKLGVAREMAPHAAIYFPHQLDFRGRSYAIPVYLNYQGDDVCRGALEFAAAKSPDSPEAQRWLKIHTANCYGVDKCSFADRCQWVDDHMPQIRRAAADPLNDDWWLQADGGDQPWQFLAACIAMTDPEAAAHLPIGQDGTCNGLQHYAALGRDEAGAAAVNLRACDESQAPSDIYSQIAAIVRARVEQDAIAGKDEARGLVVSRKLVKQPTMTSVYGVTAVGARHQIKDRLKDMGYKGEELYKVSKYLSTITLEAIGQTCVAAREIMDWLRSCARLIADQDQPVAWTTPLGLPVVQPYRAWRTVRVQTVVQTITLRVEDETLPVARRKQVDGTPPNYIHCIDSSHKFMTALACKARGIDFAHVHDKFMTHAATSPALARTLREQFMALHSAPLLQQLHGQWCAAFPDAEFDAPPEQGSYNLAEIMEAPYAFS